MRPSAPGMTADPLGDELHAWTWLERLGHEGGRPDRLTGIPEEASDVLAGLGMDAVSIGPAVLATAPQEKP